MLVAIHHMARPRDEDPRRRIAWLEEQLNGCISAVALPAEASPRKAAEVYAACQVLVTRRLDGNAPPLPRLRLLQVPAAGHDLIDTARLPPAAAVSVLTAHGSAAGEFAMAAMLEWSIGLSAISAGFRAGHWRHGSAVGAAPHGELLGRTVSILGYGEIGRAIARRARAFGMRVEALSRTRPEGPQAIDAWHRSGEVEALARNADFLVLACPLTDRTRGLVDATVLSAMKPTAVLINLARAEVVVDEHLFEALRSHGIRGAVIDVWRRYPDAADRSPRPSPLPFHELDNVIMTPHVASWTDGTLQRRWDGIARNLRKLVRGEPLENVVFPTPTVWSRNLD